MKSEVLAEDEIALIDDATMSILSNTGIAVYERQSQELLDCRDA